MTHDEQDTERLSKYTPSWHLRLVPIKYRRISLRNQKYIRPENTECQINVKSYNESYIKSYINVKSSYLMRAVQIGRQTVIPKCRCPNGARGNVKTRSFPVPEEILIKQICISNYDNGFQVVNISRMYSNRLTRAIQDGRQRNSTRK